MPLFVVRPLVLQIIIERCVLISIIFFCSQSYVEFHLLSFYSLLVMFILFFDPKCCFQYSSQRQFCGHEFTYLHNGMLFFILQLQHIVMLDKIIWPLQSFRILVFNVSIGGKTASDGLSFPLYVPSFSLCSVQCFNQSMLWEFLFWSCLFDVLCASCISMSLSFLCLGKFSPMVLLKIWSISLAWDSSPYFVPIIHGIYLFIMSQSSCIFLSRF